jgi:phosphate starvation-inducible membrane PsiE
LHTTFLELLVLAVLILVMVISIYLLRRSKR